MLNALGRRLRRRGLADRVISRVCQPDDLNVSDLAGSIDLAVMIYVLHEVPDPARTLGQVATALRTGGRLLLIEPRGHCPSELFAAELRMAHGLGLVPCKEPPLDGTGRRQIALLERVGNAVQGR
jgi:SAM-dependent methyltransferase